MKLPLLFIAILLAFITSGQTIQSDVYSWKNLPVAQRETGERRQIADGAGAVNDNIEIHATTLEPGKAPHASHKHPEEELIIVKEGTVKMTINGKSQLLGPGSIAYVMPNDEHGMLNEGTTKATYYVLRYRAKKDSMKMERASESIMINWNDVAFKAHDKGGRRDFFEKATPIFRRFEMHVTTLNPGLKSHDPHTHKAEEIVLLVEGEGEMVIGSETKKTEAGDVIFLGSNVSHAISNTGTKPCTYFAFQWD